ncbi:hypothetical protein LXL04_002582 [Taraxacum kok-saghyz]
MQKLGQRRTCHPKIVSLIYHPNIYLYRFSLPKSPILLLIAMAKSLCFFFFFFFFISTLSLFISISSSTPNPDTASFPLTAHSVLTRHGFPVGLLPTDVLSYDLNLTSGEFSVNLGDPCRLILPPDNYLATYSKKVTGKIVQNRIAELNGIRVKAFFQWWGITGIKINGDDLVFEVGMVTAKYPSKNFDEVPQCVGKKHSYGVNQLKDLNTESTRTELDVRLGLISDCPDRVRHQRLLPNTSDSGPSPTSKAKKMSLRFLSPDRV